MSIIKMPPSKLVHHDDDHDFVPSQTRSLISLGSVHLTAVPFCVRQLVPSGTAVTARLMSGMLSHRLIRTPVIGNNSEISNLRFFFLFIESLCYYHLAPTTNHLVALYDACFCFCFCEMRFVPESLVELDG